MTVFAYYCKKCNLEFSTKEEIKLHWILNCIWFESAKVKCAYCKDTFLSIKYLREHWEKLYCQKCCPCLSCKKYFKTLPIQDGITKNIYYCMFTKENSALSENELISKCNYFTHFANPFLKRARFIRGFKKLTYFYKIEDF